MNTYTIEAENTLFAQYSRIVNLTNYEVTLGIDLGELRILKIEPKNKQVNYFPCDRYTEHLFGEKSDVCLFCGRTKDEVTGTK